MIPLPAWEVSELGFKILTYREHLVILNKKFEAGLISRNFVVYKGAEKIFQSPEMFVSETICMAEAETYVQMLYENLPDSESAEEMTPIEKVINEWKSSL